MGDSKCVQLPYELWKVLRNRAFENQTTIVAQTKELIEKGLEKEKEEKGK